MTEDFDRSPFTDLFGVAAFVLAVAEGRETGVWLWIGSLTAVLGLVSIAWGHSRPLISITPHSLILRFSPLRSPREILFSQIASYSTQRERLYFHFLDRTRLVIPLMLVRSRQRPALLERLSKLGLGVPGVIPPAEQGPRWYEIPLTHKTSFVISLVVAVVLTLVVLAVQCLSPP